MATDTQMKFHAAETKIMEFIEKSPKFDGDTQLAAEIGKLMTQVYEAIVALDKRDITRCI